MSFKQFINEQETLDEALITFGGRAFPKFGNVVILAGGAGSGKGFVQSKLMGIEGKIINVDDVKKWVGNSLVLKGLIKAETGFDISYEAMPLSNPDNTSKLHDIISKLHITDKVEKNLFNSIATSAPDRKPNLIFDVTLKDITKLGEISRSAEYLGYKKENIHIVWTVTPFMKAAQQNTNRGSKSGGRMVSDEILINTHTGTAMTLYQLIYGVIDVTKFMNGDMWIVFNSEGVDSELKKSGRDGSYIAKGANYFKIKSQGGSVQIPEKEIANKIASYVPSATYWKGSV